MHLEPWSHAVHGEPFRAICAHPEVMTFLGGPQPPADADATSERIQAHWDRFGFGLWAVRDTDTGALAGFAGVQHPTWWPEREHEVEIGWRLARHAWGEGFATRAGEAAIGEARMVLGLTELACFVHPDNQRSIAVAERLGFSEVERTRDPTRGEPLVVLRKLL
jgi:RimJ/RimL family protein N-acetyltransferase